MDARLRRLVELALDPKGKWYGEPEGAVTKLEEVHDTLWRADHTPPVDTEPDPEEEKRPWDEWDPA